TIMPQEQCVRQGTTIPVWAPESICSHCRENHPLRRCLGLLLQAREQLAELVRRYVPLTTRNCQRHCAYRQEGEAFLAAVSIQRNNMASLPVLRIIQAHGIFAELVHNDPYGIV